MSEQVLKEAERGGHKSDLSFFGELLLFAGRIWGKEHLWSSILEPWKIIMPVCIKFNGTLIIIALCNKVLVLW